MHSWTSLGIWDRVSMRFYKPCTSAAKENSITRTEFCAWRVGVLVYTMSCLSKGEGYLPIAFLFYGRFTSCLVVAKQTVKQSAQLFLSLDKQNVERGQLQCPWNSRVLTAPICSRDRVWNFLSPSDQNQMISWIIAYYQAKLRDDASKQDWPSVSSWRSLAIAA